jgi:putative membrane protein insertion efficiency factor
VTAPPDRVAPCGCVDPAPEKVTGAPPPGLAARFLILLARGWQWGPSAILPPSCRFDPSCSAYAITAVHRYGALKGGWLAVKRIARCRPWGGFGPDPVP